jgi:hypothetical protein
VLLTRKKLLSSGLLMKKIHSFFLVSRSKEQLFNLNYFALAKIQGIRN